MGTIQSTAKEMCDNFIQKERENGDKFYCIKDNIDWQRDIIHKAHLDRMPNDDSYNRIYDFLSSFCDLDGTAIEEDFSEVVYQTEPDVYTSDLTKWLNDYNENVYYLTEAIEQGLASDGFQLLSCAQKIYLEEIGTALLEGIIEHIEAK